MTPYRNPVLPEHHKRFFEFINDWKTVLNLNEWEIADYTNTEDRTDTDMAAIYDMDTPHRIAKMYIGKDFGIAKISDDNLEETAIHELLHLMFHPMLEAAAESGDADGRHVKGPEHVAVRVLARLLLLLGKYSRNEVNEK